MIHTECTDSVILYVNCSYTLSIPPSLSLLNLINPLYIPPSPSIPPNDSYFTLLLFLVLPSVHLSITSSLILQQSLFFDNTTTHQIWWTAVLVRSEMPLTQKGSLTWVLLHTQPSTHLLSTAHSGKSYLSFLPFLSILDTFFWKNRKL